MKKWQHFLNTTVNLIFALAVLLCGAIFLPRAMGCQNYVIMSSSMEPALSVGSLVYVKPCSDLAEIQAGDMIAFQSGDAYVTHRAIDVDREHEMITTKGDANLVNDATPVSLQNIIGKVFFHVPYIGYVLMAGQSKEGRIVIGLVIVAILGLLFVVNILVADHFSAVGVQSETTDAK